MHGRRAQVPARVLAPLMIVLTLALALLIVMSLDQPTTSEGLVLVGGLAGAVAGSLTVLFRLNGGPALEETLGRLGIAAAFVPYLTGFAAGAFSVLAVLALFAPDLYALTLAPAAVFGGVYGLLLGGWSSFILAEGGPTAAGANSIFQTALVEAAAAFQPPGSYKYTGLVSARFEPTDEKGSIVGAVRLLFGAERAPETAHDHWLTAPLRVDEGLASDKVPFDINLILPGTYVAYPNSRSVVVPAAKISELYEFTVAVDAGPISSSRSRTLPPSDSVPRRQETSERSDEGDQVPVVLVDISQTGRTVQLIELPMSGLSIQRAEYRGSRA